MTKRRALKFTTQFLKEEAFINYKIDDGAELDEDIDYYDAGEELQKEFDEMIEEQYIDCFFEGLEDGYGYELDKEDLDEIFAFDDELVIIDGEDVWFTYPSKFSIIGYNIDTENEVYKFGEYIIEEIGWKTYELREKKDIKIIKDLFGDVA